MKPKSNEKSVKGSVREKIVVLPEIMTLFEKKIFAEEHFKKNRVECAFATSDNKCTLGFAVSGRPKSLLKGNELDKCKKKEVDLVFRKTRGCKGAYSELIFGNISDIEKYKDAILDLISEELVTKCNQLKLFLRKKYNFSHKKYKFLNKKYKFVSKYVNHCGII